MNENELVELLKYSSPKTIYVVTWNNILKLLFCPFKVKAKNSIGDIKKREIVWVEQVKVTLDLKTVFIIKGKAYYYYHFDIIIDQ